MYIVKYVYINIINLSINYVIFETVAEWITEWDGVKFISWVQFTE